MLFSLLLVLSHEVFQEKVFNEATTSLQITLKHLGPRLRRNHFFFVSLFEPYSIFKLCSFCVDKEHVPLVFILFAKLIEKVTLDIL